MRHILLTGLLLLSLQTFSQTSTAVWVDKNLNADSVFQKVEVEASFPGGIKAWTKYVSEAFQKADFRKFKVTDQGTCMVRFIVDTKGNVTHVQAMNMKKSRLAKLAIEIIENGPRWNPAQQGSRFVNAYREQPITFSFQKETK